LISPQSRCLTLFKTNSLNSHANEATQYLEQHANLIDFVSTLLTKLLWQAVDGATITMLMRNNYMTFGCDSRQLVDIIQVGGLRSNKKVCDSISELPIKLSRRASSHFVELEMRNVKKKSSFLRFELKNLHNRLNDS